MASRLFLFGFAVIALYCNLIYGHASRTADKTGLFKKSSAIGRNGLIRRGTKTSEITSENVSNSLAVTGLHRNKQQNIKIANSLTKNRGRKVGAKKKKLNKPAAGRRRKPYRRTKQNGKKMVTRNKQGNKKNKRKRNFVQTKLARKKTLKSRQKVKNTSTATKKSEALPRRVKQKVSRKKLRSMKSKRKNNLGPTKLIRKKTPKSRKRIKNTSTLTKSIGSSTRRGLRPARHSLGNTFRHKLRPTGHGDTVHPVDTPHRRIRPTSHSLPMNTPSRRIRPASHIHPTNSSGNSQCMDGCPPPWIDMVSEFRPTPKAKDPMCEFSDLFTPCSGAVETCKTQPARFTCCPAACLGNIGNCYSDKTTQNFCVPETLQREIIIIVCMIILFLSSA